MDGDMNMDGWRRYPATMEAYDAVHDEVMAAAKEAGFSPGDLWKIELGFEEISVNIISYAYDGDESPGDMWLRTSCGDGRFRLELVDHGKPFDPLKHEDPRLAENLGVEERTPGGYGIFLVKKYFSSVTYRYEEMFGAMANHLTMELQIS